MSPILGILASSSSAANLAGDYESIATVNVGAGLSTSIDFTSIPQTYKHLQIRALVRNNRAATGSNTYFRFNGDTGNSYALHVLTGNGASATAGAGTSSNVMLAQDPSANFTANCFAGQIYDILDYTNTNKNKTVRILNGYDGNGSGEVQFWSGLWMNTAAVTSIRLFPNSGSYVQYTQFALYGIK